MKDSASKSSEFSGSPELMPGRESVSAGEAIISAKDNSPEKERIAERETGSTDESYSPRSSSGKKKKQERKSERSSGGGGSSAASAAGGVSGAVAAVAAVVFIATANIGGVDAKLVSSEVYGTEMNYTVSVEFDYTKSDKNEIVNFNDLDTGLRIVAYGDDYETTVALDTGDEALNCTVEATPASEKEDNLKYKVKAVFRGSLTGLREKHQYKFQVMGIKEDGSLKTHLSKSFRTTGLVSEFRSIAYLCQCSVDGYFYFDLDFSDERGYYSGFKYSMVAKDGTEVKSGAISDPTARQKIDVTDVKGKNFTLNISYDTSDPDDSDRGVYSVTKSFEIEL